MAVKLTRWTAVPEMLRRFPEALAPFAEAEYFWLTPESDVESRGPYMLDWLLETVLSTNLLLPMWRADP